MKLLVDMNLSPGWIELIQQGGTVDEVKSRVHILPFS